MNKISSDAGVKSTEFWIVLAFIADLFFKRIGLYNYISIEQLSDITTQVKLLADQIQGKTGSDSDLIYILATAYVAGRTFFKYKKQQARDEVSD